MRKFLFVFLMISGVFGYSDLLMKGYADGCEHDFLKHLNAKGQFDANKNSFLFDGQNLGIGSVYSHKFKRENQICNIKVLGIERNAHVILEPALDKFVIHFQSNRVKFLWYAKMSEVSQNGFAPLLKKKKKH